MLDFARLQSQLRHAVLARVSSGQLSSSRLARIAGYKQPHITNFLHGRRGLSLEAMDRVLRALEMSALDLVPVGALERFVHAGSDTEYEAIPVVETNALHLPLPPACAIREWIKIKRTFLNRMPAATVGKRKHWLRFVLMEATKDDAEAMYPRIQKGAVLLVDRHYNSLRPHRTGEVNIHVVRVRRGAIVRSLDVLGSQIVMRPERNSVPLEVMDMDSKQRFAEKILGRVSCVGWEV